MANGAKQPTKFDNVLQEASSRVAETHLLLEDRHLPGSAAARKEAIQHAAWYLLAQNSTHSSWARASRLPARILTSRRFVSTSCWSFYRLPDDE